MGPVLEVARVLWPAGAVGSAEWPSQMTKPYISCPLQGGGFMHAAANLDPKSGPDSQIQDGGEGGSESTHNFLKRSTRSLHRGHQNC